jgi:hypothetical protein
MQLLDFQNGIHAFDAGYVRHQLAAIHLIVDDGRAPSSIPAATAACPTRLLRCHNGA